MDFSDRHKFPSRLAKVEGIAINLGRKGEEELKEIEKAGEDILKVFEEHNRWRRAVEIANRLPKYVQGYLWDFDVMTEKDYDNNPISITIRIYWRKSDKKDITFTQSIGEVTKLEEFQP